MILKEYSFQAGLLNYNTQTKKCTADKRKGKIRVYKNDEEEIHFTWVNDQNEEEFDRIVFGFETKFLKFEKIKRVALLKSESDEEYYFFWIQEKDASKDNDHIQKINQIIQDEQENTKMEIEEQPKSVQQTQQSQPQQNQQQQGQILDPNFLQNLQNQVLNNRKNTPSILKVLNKTFINELLQNQEQAEELFQYLPPNQQNIQGLRQSLNSAQFQQSIDQLEQALNSEQGQIILQQMQLNPQSFYQTYDGVGTLYQELIKKYKK